MNIFFARSMLVGFVVSILGFIVWGLWASNEPVPEASDGRQIITPQVRRGDFLIITNARTGNSSCSGWVYRQVVDASGDLVTSESDFRPPITDSINAAAKSIRRIAIPAYASIGTAYYSVTIQWSCNLWQRIFPEVRTLPRLQFEIIDGAALPPASFGHLGFLMDGNVQ